MDVGDIEDPITILGAVTDRLLSALRLTLAAAATLQLVAYCSLSGSTVSDDISSTALNATLLATT